jgi:hypothetical protein
VLGEASGRVSRERDGISPRLGRKPADRVLTLILLVILFIIVIIIIIVILLVDRAPGRGLEGHATSDQKAGDAWSPGSAGSYTRADAL